MWPARTVRRQRAPSLRGRLSRALGREHGVSTEKAWILESHRKHSNTTGYAAPVTSDLSTDLAGRSPGGLALVPRVQRFDDGAGPGAHDSPSFTLVEPVKCDELQDEMNERVCCTRIVFGGAPSHNPSGLVCR